MNIISFHYKNAPLNVREKVSCSADDVQKIYYSLKKHNTNQCIVLETCNRTEFYYTDLGDDTISELICDIKHIDKNFIKKYANKYTGDSAIAHLIKVACGVDSMVLGEDDILRQLKETYQYAHDEGMTGYELNTVFRMSLQAAKAIKTSTGLSTIPVSIGTLAVNEVFKLSAKTKHVLVLGATGKMGSIVVKNLLSHDDVEVTGTYRKHGLSSDKEPIIALSSVREGRFKSIDFTKRYDVIQDMDAIISATSSPHLTITRDRLEDVLPDSYGDKLFIDLAVPADIDDEIAGLHDCKLLNIDYFEVLARENNLRKQSQANTAISSVDEWVDIIASELSMHKLVNMIPDLENSIDSFGLDKLIYSLRKTEDRETISRVVSWIEKYLRKR